ncbi:MAG: amino acid transporter, periplasmic amino acid-binding protein [Parachlamydiales bacterium]|nr:amino acid transporter, periplasmic amino acid-binding protein [Parachlamydiales bacterium]
MKRPFFHLCVLAVVFFTAFLLPSCGGGGKNDLSIGIDPNWYPQNFQGKEVYVNGFIEELLLEISRHSGLEFSKIGTSWDSLYDNLKRHRYDAVISSLPAYNFNAAQYDFSKNVLDIGSVLVVSTTGQQKSMKDMEKQFVGVMSGEQALLIMQKYPEVFTRTYLSAPEIFEAVASHEVEGIVVDRLLAVSYVQGSYAQKLKIVGSPLSDSGLHFVVMKDENPHAIQVLNKSIDYLIKKKKLQKLQKKWNLAP